MKIYQIVSEQDNRTVSKIVGDVKKLSPQEQEVFKELVLTRPDDIAKGKTKRSTDGRSFKWNGSQWVNVESGRPADDKMHLNLSTKGKVTPTVRRLYQTAKDQKLIEPIRKELEKPSTRSGASRSSVFKRKKKDKNDGKGYQGTGLISAMTKATGYSTPSKERGAEPEIYKSREKKKDDEINQRLKDLIAKQDK